MRTWTATLFTFIVFLSYANLQRPNADRKTTPPNETKKRHTDHIDDILLRPDPIGYDDNDPNIKAVLKELRTIYQNMIRPMEKQFRYADLRRHTMSDVDIYAKPIILLVGPWSTGKSTMINYLLGIEGALESLYVGAEPTTGDFTVLSYGEEYRTVEGVVLATDATKPFASMEKFGQIFLEHLLGVEMNRPLLRNVSFIDTPGILENRRQQERGYPYNDVMRWLVHRSDLIFVVFDPTKLDVGYELETLFKQLKGKESVLRIILNKADSMSEQDLMRVYGALFWSLSPLINVTEPPRVYVGSFWGEPFHDDDLAEVLLREEKSLLHDMREVIRNRVYNKIAFVRQYAIRVRIHALLVDSYVAAYRRNKGLFGGSDELARQIMEDPDGYDVFKTVLGHPNVSKYDLPDQEEYEEFFRINPLPDQRRISEHCGYFSGCAIDELNQAISNDLPILLRRFRTPNERRGQKRGSFEPQGDFATWHREHEMKKKTKKESEEADDHPVRGAKKYRKSAPVDHEPTSEEKEESVQPPQEVKRRGRPAKSKESKPAPEGRSSKLSGKSKERTSGEDIEVKEQTRKKRKSRDRSESAEAETKVKVPEPEPEPETPPVPEKVEPPQVHIVQEIPSQPESAEVEIEVAEEPTESIEEEPPSPPSPPPTPKASRKSKKDEPPPPSPVSPKFKASVKESEEAEEKPRGKREESEEDEDDDEEATQETPPEATKHGKHHKEAEPPPPAHKKPEIPHKGSGKKSGESEKKKLAPKQSPRPSPPPSNTPSVKCSKYRKSCQEDGAPPETTSKQPQPKTPPPTHKPAPTPSAASGTKCNKYRKDCNADAGDSKAPAPSKPESPKVAVVKENPKPKAAPAPEGKKCNKYRKDCQETVDATESKTVKKTESHHEDRPHKAHKESNVHKETKAHKESNVHTAKHTHSVSPSTKCSQYRKSCQQDTESTPKSEPVDKKAPKDHHPHPQPVVVDEETKCGRYSYRFSCRGEKRDDDEKPKVKPHHEKKAEEKEKRPEVKVAAPSHVAPKSGKCNKYRKDCQSDESPVPGKAPVVKPEPVSEPKSKPPKPSKASESHHPHHPSPPVVVASGKCNKYRKDCQGGTQDSPVVTSPPPRVVEKTPTVSSPSTGGPCNKYRKSCHDSSPDSSKPQPPAKPAAKKSSPAPKEEAKPKKLCKKNATANPSPNQGAKKDHKKSAKAAPAAAPAQVQPQQNKWRKPKTPPPEQLITS